MWHSEQNSLDMVVGSFWYAVNFIASTTTTNTTTTTVSDVASRQHLRSASRRLLVLPRHRLRTYGWRAFSFSGLSAWNSLPDNLRDSSVSRQLLQTFEIVFVHSLLKHRAHSRGFTRMRYTNLTYLLTYLLTYFGTKTLWNQIFMLKCLDSSAPDTLAPICTRHFGLTTQE